MKKMTLLLFTTVLATGTATAGQDTLTVKFADDAWNGKSVPAGQQCQKFGGNNPATPALNISNIPTEATAIVMEYSDRTYKPMDKGGHGKLGFLLSGNVKLVTVPAVKGHSFELPEGFFSVAMHQGPDWDIAGAYMPPCSGGNNHPYYVTIKAVKQDTMTVLAEKVVEMGIY